MAIFFDQKPFFPVYVFFQLSLRLYFDSAVGRKYITLVNIILFVLNVNVNKCKIKFSSDMLQISGQRGHSVSSFHVWHSLWLVESDHVTWMLTSDWSSRDYVSCVACWGYLGNWGKRLIINGATLTPHIHILTYFSALIIIREQE